MHLAVLMANTDESAFAQRHLSDADKWRSLVFAQCPDCKISVYSVKDGIFPKGEPSQFDGLIITGSPASVHEGSPWQTRLMLTIQQAVKVGVPVFGACYGHQAVALALGGTVGYNEGGWTFGVTQTDVTNPAPWMGGFSGPMLLNAAHKEQVTTAPDGAQIINSSSDCPIGGFQIGESVFTTQYHPEITPDFMAALIEELSGELSPDVTDRARSSLMHQPENALFGKWVMQFFLQQKI